LQVIYIDNLSWKQACTIPKPIQYKEATWDLKLEAWLRKKKG
jgi:hypothetical protein